MTATSSTETLISSDNRNTHFISVYGDEEDDIANAKLIAAAPELLEAILEFKEYINYFRIFFQ